MTRKRRFGTAMFVAVVGSFVSGCCALGTADKNEGRFCASPVEGGQYCEFAPWNVGSWLDSMTMRSIAS